MAPLLTAAILCFAGLFSAGLDAFAGSADPTRAWGDHVHALLSYESGGLASPARLKELLGSAGGGGA